MGANGIYGLSGSGMDIESMVKVGMMKKQNEYDKMVQAQTIDEWTKSAYLDVNSKITTFNASTLSQYKMSSSMNARIAESNSSAVKVTANASAGVMSHQVSVNSLSSNAYLVGTNALTRYSTDKTSLNLKDVLFASYTVDEATQTISGSVAGVTAPSKVKGDGNELTNPWGFGKNVTTEDGTTTYPANNQVSLSDVAFSFKISDGKNTAEVSYTYKELLGTEATDLEPAKSPVTFNDFVSKINGLGLNIRASYDSVNDRFSFFNSEGGEANTISITLDSDSGIGSSRSSIVARNFFDNMGLYQSRNGALIGNGGVTEVTDADGNTTPVKQGDANSMLFTLGGKTEFKGTNGSITVDGIVYDKITDNKVTVGGITYTGLAETNGTSATVTVTQDVEEIVDKVKSFVEDYNKLLSSLRDIYEEKRDSNYKPLTPAQKEAMKEEQITKWEEKAKKGLLYRDQSLGKIIDEMRDAIMTSVDGVEGKYNSAYSIGISSTGIKGQLVLDETKLRKALSEDSDAVYNVFARLDDSQKDKNGNVVNNPSGNGIAQRLSDIFFAANKTIKDIAGSSEATTEDSVYNNRMRERQTKMSDFKKTMQALEDILYKKYDTMEAMLTSLYAQMNFITSCFQQ